MALIYDQLHLYAKFEWNLSSYFQYTLWKNKKLKLNIVLLYMGLSGHLEIGHTL